MPILTDFERKVQRENMKSLNKLKLVLVVSVAIPTILLMVDIVQWILNLSQGNDLSCDVFIEKESLKWINSFIWLFTRFCQI